VSISQIFRKENLATDPRQQAFERIDHQFRLGQLRKMRAALGHDPLAQR